MSEHFKRTAKALTTSKSTISKAIYWKSLKNRNISLHPFNYQSRNMYFVDTSLFLIDCIQSRHFCFSHSFRLEDLDDGHGILWICRIHWKIKSQNGIDV